MLSNENYNDDFKQKRVRLKSLVKLSHCVEAYWTTLVEFVILVKTKGHQLYSYRETGGFLSKYTRCFIVEVYIQGVSKEKYTGGFILKYTGCFILKYKGCFIVEVYKVFQRKNIQDVS